MKKYNKGADKKADSKVKEITNTVFKSIGLAMGVAVVVLSILNQLDAQTSVTMLGMGLVCLALSTLNNKE